MKLQIDDMAHYLDYDEIIDFGFNPQCTLTKLANEILTFSKDEIDCIKNTFEYVRDKIFHSADIQGQSVTCKASEVLLAKEGICFAKSHLLAALLRCNQIPTGFCYQRLILNDEMAPCFVLHGLKAVYVERFDKWVRLDARGNKLRISTPFSLERENLAFEIRPEQGEEDTPIIFATPDRNVIRALENSKNLETLWSNLPTELHCVY